MAAFFHPYMNTLQARFHEWWFSDPFVELERELKKAAHPLLRDAAKQTQIPVAASGELQKDKERNIDPFEEYHRMMQRSAIPVPTEEELADRSWEEYHQMMQRSLLENMPTHDKVRHHEDMMDMFARTPRVHVVQRTDDYVIVADIPGVKKEDIKVELIDSGHGTHLLKISGERSNNISRHNEKEIISKKVYGEFTRTIRLPTNTDLAPESIKVDYEHGTLNLTVPRSKEPEKVTAPRSIRIHVN